MQRTALNRESPQVSQCCGSCVERVNEGRVCPGEDGGRHDRQGEQDKQRDALEQSGNSGTEVQRRRAALCSSEMALAETCDVTGLTVNMMWDPQRAVPVAVQHGRHRKVDAGQVDVWGRCRSPYLLLAPTPWVAGPSPRDAVGETSYPVRCWRPGAGSRPAGRAASECTAADSVRPVSCRYDRRASS